MSLNDVATLLGIVLSISALTLGILNYLRDNPNIFVDLKWDMSVTNNPIYDKTKMWGVITVTNVGRRPAYVSHVALRFPKGAKQRYLLYLDIAGGERLTEGDAPRTFVIDQEQVKECSKGVKINWRDIRAQVTASTGKIYKSKKHRKKPKPSWVVT